MSCQSLVQSHTSSHHRHLVAARLTQHLGKRETERKAGREVKGSGKKGRGEGGKGEEKGEYTKKANEEVFSTLHKRVRVKEKVRLSHITLLFPILKISVFS